MSQACLAEATAHVAQECGLYQGVFGDMSGYLRVLNDEPARIADLLSLGKNPGM